jgi:hypothetical protein
MFAIGFFVVNVWYQSRKEKRASKILVFSQILSAQAFMDYAKVKALNSIEIVFYDSKEIIDAWRNYKNALKIKGEKATDEELDAVKKTEKLLLEKMARHLGYKNITWDTVDDPYYPKWIAEDEINKLNMGKLIKNMNASFGHPQSGKPPYNKKK